MDRSEWSGHRVVLADLLAMQARLRREPATWHPAHLDLAWRTEPAPGPWPAPGEVPAMQRRIGHRPAPGELPALQRRIGRRLASIKLRIAGGRWYVRPVGDIALHGDLEHLAFLLGTWRGSGTGIYPTIDDFVYEEEIRIDHVGDTYLTYMQRSWSSVDGAAIHLERGFIRPGLAGEVELTLAHPLGLTEVAHGSVDGTVVALTAERGDVGRTHTGSDVTGLRRRYEVAGDTLTYELDMATERTPMTRHLAAALRRQP
jgi:hypothetical protein